MFPMLIRITANGNDIQAGLAEHRLVIGVGANPAAVFGAERLGVQAAGRVNRGDLRMRACINGGDMRARNPSVTNDANL